MDRLSTDVRSVVPAVLPALALRNGVLRTAPLLVLRAFLSDMVNAADVHTRAAGAVQPLDLQPGCQHGLAPANTARMCGCAAPQVAFSAFTDFGPIMALAIALHNIPEVSCAALVKMTGQLIRRTPRMHPYGNAHCMLVPPPHCACVERSPCVSTILHATG